MSSIVRDLQINATGSDTPISELLRKALIVAKRLNLDNFEVWIRSELNGYDPNDELPKYRIVDGQLKATHPLTGSNMPVLIKDDEMAELFSHGYLRQPAAELRSIVNDAGDQYTLILPLPPKMANTIASGKNPHVAITKAQVNNIIESIRNFILDWCLKLEDEGIVGEDLDFTEQELERARANVINIKNVFGNIYGNIQGETIQIGDFNELNNSLESAGVSESEREELIKTLNDLKKSDDPEKKETLVKSASNWIGDHADTIGALSETIRQWIMFFSQ